MNKTICICITLFYCCDELIYLNITQDLSWSVATASDTTCRNIPNNIHYNSAKKSWNGTNIILTCNTRILRTKVLQYYLPHEAVFMKTVMAKTMIISLLLSQAIFGVKFVSISSRCHDKQNSIIFVWIKARNCILFTEGFKLLTCTPHHIVLL